MRKRKNKPEKLSEILGSSVKDEIIKLGVALLPVWQKWSQIIGKDFTSEAEISGFKRGILYVKVKDTVLMDRLMYEKDRILTSIHQMLGAELIQDIFFELHDETEDT